MRAAPAITSTRLSLFVFGSTRRGRSIIYLSTYRLPDMKVYESPIPRDAPFPHRIASHSRDIPRGQRRQFEFVESEPLQLFSVASRVCGCSGDSPQAYRRNGDPVRGRFT